MFQNTIVMLRRSIRKRVNPVGRGDFVAPAARRVIAPRTNITALQDTATNQISTISPGISTQVIGLPTVSDVSSMASINTDTIAVSSTSTTSSQSITGNAFVVADNFNKLNLTFLFGHLKYNCQLIFIFVSAVSLFQVAY